jgi:putative transposase
MQKTRKRYSADFKAKVALEAVKGQKTLSELSSQFQIHPNQITQWKKQLFDEAPILFSNKSDKLQKQQNQLEDRLYKQIGQLTVENDWLKKKLLI